ncbi:MAG: hypothetical protein V3U10_04235, partial [Bacteroidota bacterium]
TNGNRASRGLIRDYRVWSLCAVFLGVGILSLKDTMIFTPDSARYPAWSRSVAFFEGYKDLLERLRSKSVTGAPVIPILLIALILPAARNLA